jgi:integrase
MVTDLPSTYRRKLTAGFVAKAKFQPTTKNSDRTFYWDETLPGFGLVNTSGSHRSYCVQYYNSKRHSRRMTIDGVLNLTEARREAKAILGKVAKGGDPLQERKNQAESVHTTLRSVAENFFGREGKKLRSIGDRRASFERLIFPKFGSRQIDSIRRSEIVRLLDDIEDERGPQMARVVLGHLSRLFNWHAARCDSFLTPIVRGMARVKPSEHSRDRVLSDDEIRAIWRAAESMASPFGRFVQLALLTATRRNEAARMARDELAGGTWTIPAARMKGGVEHVIPLSAKARAIVDSAPAVGPYVFTTDGRRPIRGFTRFKAAIDRLSGVTGWRLHDLRRTARSLLSRAGVDANIAERCLAHSIGGVRGVYDRHSYFEEKRRAFEALAALVERIVDPQPNVLPMRGMQSVPG